MQEQKQEQNIMRGKNKMTKLQAKKIKFYKKQYYQMIKRHNALLKKTKKVVKIHLDQRKKIMGALKKRKK